MSFLSDLKQAYRNLPPDELDDQQADIEYLKDAVDGLSGDVSEVTEVGGVTLGTSVAFNSPIPFSGSFAPKVNYYDTTADTDPLDAYSTSLRQEPVYDQDSAGGYPSEAALAEEFGHWDEFWPDTWRWVPDVPGVYWVSVIFSVTLDGPADLNSRIGAALGIGPMEHLSSERLKWFFRRENDPANLSSTLEGYVVAPQGAVDAGMAYFMPGLTFVPSAAETADYVSHDWYFTIMQLYPGLPSDNGDWEAYN